MANKNTRKAAAPARILAARKSALAGVRNAAFTSGTSRNALLAATFAACGKTPVLALYQAARLELQVGLMAAALVRKGDNRDGPVLMDHCRSRITEYAGFGGTGKIRSDQKGRRSKDEEAAYGSARVLVSGIFKDAGVKVPEARGGDTSKTRAARPAAKATAAAKPATNDNAKPAIVRVKTREALNERCGILAAALLATVNRNAALAPIELKSAVEDLCKRIKAL